jgi:hypothetical protein
MDNTSADNNIQEQQPAAKPRFGRTLIVTVCFTLFALVVIGIQTLVGLNQFWIAFLGLNIWTALGSKMKIKEILKVWAGALTGLLLLLLLGWVTTQFGASAGLVLQIALIFIVIFCIVGQRLIYFFNLPCGFFLTILSAMPEHVWQWSFDILYGFIIIGLVPFALVKLGAKFKSGKTDQ